MVTCRYVVICAESSAETSCKLAILAPVGRTDSRPSVTRIVTEDVNAVTKLTSEAESAIHDGDMSQVAHCI